MIEKLFNIKKRFFNQTLKQIQAEIWSTEFSRFTTATEYEKTRQLYSQGQDQLSQVEAQLKIKKEDRVLIDQKEKLSTQLERLKTNLEELDIIINGAEPSEKYPEGVRGLTSKLEAQVNKKNNIKSFIKHYC